ncbi:sporulation protein [Peterkaempfera bronchialis]|uniref:Sporulation protein n=1 Tax=Peterkaempfera bronchialis TaxID=2126346 RepID=A0A345T267_9ACTN|nr:sporulation protein [Peterkaempfera bronchialis]AXI80072.1 sporulation protein [Peterkaempfera bronchialis]
MGLKRILAALGAGGASVETVLHEPNVVPGGVVHGEVRIQGGAVDQRIEGLTLGLQARVEVETQDSEYRQHVEFHRQRIGDGFALKEGAVHVVPFALHIPYETPVTAVAGQRLRGTAVGVATELAIDRAVDAGDLDPVEVHPLPVQHAVLDALARLGFRLKGAELERGHLRNTRQRLPFYQEIEFFAPPRYPGLNEVELSFIADETAVDVVLEMDRKGGLSGEGSDALRSFTVAHSAVGSTDWADYLHQWIHAVGGRRGWI